MKKEIPIASALILDVSISPTAKVIYAVLKSFQTGKAAFGGESSITVTHREIVRVSGLSQNTVVKALNNLEESGWIKRELNCGFASRHIFTTPELQNCD